ncbi:MAG: DUF2207 domain-containing protein [Candidatus Micrarchaeota archaeon]
MKNGLLVFFLLFLSVVFPFSIESYNHKTTVLANGDLQIYEVINFTLDENYSEGFRTIRNEDCENLDDIAIKSIKVNGFDVPYKTQYYNGKVEIVWEKTYPGTNNVELEYTLKDRGQLYDDFAKICIEHYGAGWEVIGKKFHSEVVLPGETYGKEMHFEIYSDKDGQAIIDNLTIVVDIPNVPPGSYVGGCYLYDKSALQTDNIVSGSAYEILEDERKIYGSKNILSAEQIPPLAIVCLPAALIIGGVAIVAFNKEKKRPHYPESILPPEKEEPEIISILVRNSAPKSDIMAATLLDLINRGILDIIEMGKEKTILVLKKRQKNLKEKESILIEMIFNGGNTHVNLDHLASDFDAIKTKEEAHRNTISRGIEKFDNAVTKTIKENKLDPVGSLLQLKWLFLVVIILCIPFGLCIGSSWGAMWFAWAIVTGNYLDIIGVFMATAIFIASCGYLASRIYAPEVPKEREDQYAKWDGFVRAIKSSRLKEYPPESVKIWGGILVYATAIGLADRVKMHLSELNRLVVIKMERLDKIRLASQHFHRSALALNNLRKYGNRKGRTSGGSHGGFSSRSSGGWSSRGGGFSRSSSGGGGFRR